MQSHKPSKTIPNIAFFFSIFVLVLNLHSFIFPALLIRITSADVYTPINQWEIGHFALPFILSNLILVSIGILYHKKALPNILIKIIRFALNFDVSPKIAFLFLISVLSIYCALSIQELNQDEGEIWADIRNVKNSLANWPPEHLDSKNLLNFHTKLFFLSISNLVFNNLRIIPFITSIALVLLTYFCTTEFTKKRLSGLIAASVLLQSNLFLTFDTLATYSNFWVIFYLLSIYSIQKKWYISPLGFVLSVFSKYLSALYLPGTIYFILRSDISKNHKMKLLGSYFLIIFSALITISIIPQSNLTKFIFHIPRFFTGFTVLSYQLRDEVFVSLFLIPVVVGLYIRSRQKVLHADSIMIMLVVIILSSPILTGLLNFQINPYRLIPMIVFFAIGTGLLFSNHSGKINSQKVSIESPS